MEVRDLDMTYRFAMARLASGVTLRYAAQGEPGGEPVLFLHGWPDSWFSFSRMLPMLPPHVLAIAPDQRGFGGSDRPAGGYEITDMATDVLHLLDTLSLERVTLVGHSYGSFVARRLSVLWPERVARLVLIGSGATADNPVTRDVHAELMNLPDPVPADFARAFQASTVFHPVPEAFFAGVVSESLKLPARLWKRVFERLLAYDDREDLARIAAPTLLIWGERDAIFPRDDQRYLVAAIRGARLITYAETGHCPNWERPDRVVLDLLTFIGDTPVRA